MNKLHLALAFSIVAFVGSAAAQLSTIPPNIVATNSNKPMVMLTASKDFTMFWKAYTDFEDIDFDGQIDYTFKPSFSYYGYFDPLKCYTYNTANDGVFEPYAAATVEDGKYYCTAGAGQWSGNFLNWATMSRIDVLRKILYGGLRSAHGANQADRTTNGDTATSTTLEQSFVPRNSQAFVKYYNGADLDRLTPFNSAAAMDKGITLCRRAAENSGTSHANDSLFTPQIRVAIGNYIMWNMTEVRSCNWSTEVAYTWNTATISFLTDNYTSPNGVKGSTDADYVHPASVPVLATNGATYDAGAKGPGFTARVKVCVAADNLEPGCKLYGSVYKPTGLLHQFGESTSYGNQPARAEFGLMMGSYDHNLQAGVLRKNMGEINDEIDPTNGIFRSPGTGKGGIIKSLNEITLYGYNAGTGNYSENCRSDTLADGSCPSWGNPVGELLLEANRYFAGQNQTWAGDGTKDGAAGLPAVTTWMDPVEAASDAITINALKKRGALYGRGICRPLNLLTVTGGINSYDNGALSAFSDITNTTTPAALTKILGDKEGVTGTTRLVGSNGGAAAGDQNLQCTGKVISDLSLIEGICPDGPNFKGTYLGAGVSHYVNTNPVRTDLDTAPIPDLPHNALTVRNYGVTMSGGVATIEVPMPGQAECSVANGGLGNPACKRTYITPASLDSVFGGTTKLPGNMVDFKVLGTSIDSNGFASGSALVLWQHAMLGEDQDQDMLNSIRWEVTGSASEPILTVYTQAVESNTGSQQQFGFGYTLVGTANDGLHMHSGINKFLVEDPTGVSVSSAALVNEADDGTDCRTDGAVGNVKKLCSKLGATGNVVRGETYKSFKMTGATNASLKDPLWFIAKYGGFKYTKGDKNAAAAGALYPTRNNQWDRRKADGTACTGTPADPCDGNPDNYFYARRPDLLEKSLREILEDIVNSSNTAPAIASSQLQSGDLKIVATFDPDDGSGALRSYALKSNGFFADVGEESWNAHTLLTALAWDTRQVITNQDGIGISFTWSLLSDPKMDVLKGGSDAAYGQKVLRWLRGETTYAAEFRPRPASSIMGPIVNSNPVVQTRPDGRYFGDFFSGYAEFVENWASRRLVLWAGAGDGMLHAFDASNTNLGGKPILSYIPDPVFSRLPDWASPNGAKVQSFVDGSPFVGDIKVGNTWYTYLFSSLGRGGKAIFALDVTQAGIATTDKKGTVDTADDVTTVTGSQLDEAHASAIFKWQLTSEQDSDLGYIVSEPTSSRITNQPGQIAMMNNGRFAALFGNGVDSATGKAALFILFADGLDVAANGGKYKKLVVPIGESNGLSTPTWVDVNNDRVADYIYAGDIKGNLWRFDVSSANPNDWAVSYFQKPLFTAKDEDDNPLPITGAPETKFHPLGGVVVNIVTGISLKTEDFPNTARTNGLFGIWDKPAFATLTTASAMEDALPRSLSVLKGRKLNNFNGDNTTRYVTNADPDDEEVNVNWTDQLGWYLFFNVESEMGLNNLTIANNQVLTVTVSPAPPKTGADTDPCSDTPIARLVGVDPITGLPSGLLGTETETDVDTIITYVLASVRVADQKVQIVKDLVGQGSTQAGCANGSLNCTAVEGASASGKRLNSNIGFGRIFWREIPGFKTN